MTWHERLKEKAGSNRKAAERIFREWKRKARKEVDREKTTEQALANKIGTLRSKGDATRWWADRPVLQQLLADLIELEVSEIFGAPSHTHAPTFREFPALPPLERDEVPFRTSRSGSVFDLARTAVNDTARRFHWLVVPPGGGKSLAIELLHARFPGEVSAQKAVRLGDAVTLTRNDARPIVVEVEEPDSTSDMQAVGALALHGASVVVLAPFEHPDERIREWTSSLPGDSSRTWNATWATKRGAPDDGWIARMLEWIDRRLASSSRDTKFDKEQVLVWLEKNPSVKRAVQSPGDLLALCADFDAYGIEGTAHERADRWLRSFGVRALPKETPRSWSTYAAANCVMEMISKDALDRTTVLHQRSFLGWSAIVPSGAPSSENMPGTEFVIGLLRGAGLLRADEYGVTVFPRWIGGALAQRQLVQLMKDRDVQTWGAIAGDASRQSLVDDALDVLTPSDRRDLGEALLASIAGKPVTFADVAALEALVAALGRHFTSDDHDPRDADLGRRALGQQLGFLVNGASTGERRVPTTRRDRNEWFLSGWAISLASDRGEVEVPTDLRWVLPGWSSQLRLSEAAPHNDFPWSSVQPWGASNAVQLLMQLTPKAVERLHRSDVPKDIPRLLVPALVLADGWKVTHEHFMQLAGSWEESVLADALTKIDSARQQSLATMFWQLASDAVGAPNGTPVAERIIYLQTGHPRLLPFVLEHLPASIVEETARLSGTHRRPLSGTSYVPSDPRALRHLSFEQRAAAVRGRLSTEVRFDEVRELVEVLDRDDLDVLLDVVRVADRSIAWEFASRIWRVLPERAEAEARRAFDEGRAAAEAWFRTAPRARFGVLLEMIEARRTKPQWLRDWALARLLDAGVYAEPLFRFIRPEPVTSTTVKRTGKKRGGKMASR